MSDKKSLSGNIIDRTIEIFAPTWARKRTISRAQLSMWRNYEGASQGKRTAGWTSAQSDRDGAAEARMGQREMWRRSRDLCRNNGYGVRAQTVVMNAVVGTGILPVVNQKTGGKRANEALQAYLDSLVTKSKELDLLGQLPLLGLQYQAICGVMESGEVFVRRVWMERADRGTLPFKLQILEPDYLNTTRDYYEWSNGNKNKVRGGIEYDSKDRVVAYHFYKEHPGADGATLVGTRDDVRVDAKDVLHLLDDRRRPGPGRGAPWLAPVIVRMFDHAEFNDAVLLRQKLANCFGAFVEGMEPQEDPTLDKTAAGHEIELIEPAALQYLAPGERIQFANPPGSPDHDKYDAVILREIAAAVGITYEALSGNLARVNYSSGRMGRLQQDANVRRWQRSIMVCGMLSPIGEWIVEGLNLTRGLGKYSLSGVSIDWSVPAQPIVDPSKEIRPLREQVRAGFISPQEVIRQQGRNPDTVLDEIQEWNKQLDQREIKLDSDPRYLSSNGVNAGILDDDDDDDDDGEGEPGNSET